MDSYLRAVPRRGDGVFDQRHGGAEGVKSALDGHVRVGRDRSRGQDGTDKGSAGPEGRGATNLPEDVAPLSLVDQGHGGGGGGREGGSHLKDPEAGRIIGSVKHEAAGQLRGGAEMVDAFLQGHAPQILASQVGGEGKCGRHRVSCHGVGVGRQRLRVTRRDGAALARRKAGDGGRSVGVDSQQTIHGAGARAGDGRSRHDAKGRGGFEINERAGGRAGQSQREDERKNADHVVRGA